MTLDEAIDIVAHAVAFQAVQEFLEDYGWAEYPDIGVYAWLRVADEAHAVVSTQNPALTEFEEASAFLEAHAQGVRP